MNNYTIYFFETMTNYDITLVTTHQDTSEIFTLIESIEKSNKTISALLVIVSQESPITYESKNSNFSVEFINEKKMGLSKARNIALKYLIINSISSKYIMFPDDDSSFDSLFFENFGSKLNSNQCFITPIYNDGTKELYFGKPTFNGKVITPLDHQLIGSPNQIILYDKFKNQIAFDEKLGVGALYGSSEDVDLFLKLFEMGERFIFTNDIYTYHPKKTSAYNDLALSKIILRFKNYSLGFGYIIFKYKLFSLIPEYLIRTFGAFILFFCRLNFKLSFAYLIQFFIRIKILFMFLLNKNLYLKN